MSIQAEINRALEELQSNLGEENQQIVIWNGAELSSISTTIQHFVDPGEEGNVMRTRGSIVVLRGNFDDVDPATSPAFQPEDTTSGQTVPHPRVGKFIKVRGIDYRIESVFLNGNGNTYTINFVEITSGQ